MTKKTSTELKRELDQATRMLVGATDPGERDRIREYVRELERLFEAAADSEERKA
ncbi:MULTISPECIES: hypothetical protein [unclassified Tardiphaga]|uniref:hypothetical protein n=1 Tax=unclassified Tardiphaga TaxID=2631404 RepID=UPI00143D6160|nr:MULTISPECIES: hypothetical protein [unclassified Tardiphaga]